MRLEATVLAETIDGAHAYGADGAPIGRSCARSGRVSTKRRRSNSITRPRHHRHARREPASIHCDLGTTAAHVIVIIAVTGLSAIVTYTDVHRKRISSCRTRCSRSRSNGPPHRRARTMTWSIGRWAAATPDDLERYLTHLGSRLVFLIDWNRARKRLDGWSGESEATGLLKWAADNNVGHRGFLQVDDNGVIDAALERAAPVHLRPAASTTGSGRRRPATSSRRCCASPHWALTAGRSMSLIEDEIEAGDWSGIFRRMILTCCRPSLNTPRSSPRSPSACGRRSCMRAATRRFTSRR